MTDDVIEERWRSAVRRALGSQIDENDADAQRAAKIATSVKDYLFDPAHITAPYKAWFGTDVDPTDLSDQDLRIVAHLAHLAEDWRIRFRCFDLISLRLAGRAQVEAALAVLESLRDGLSAKDVKPCDMEMVTRGLELGRFGAAHREILHQIEDKVLELILAPLPNLYYISFSRYLRQDKRTHRHARRLAGQFAFSAGESRFSLELEEGAEWALIAGDRDRSDNLFLDLTLALQNEARTYIEEGRLDTAFFATDRLGQALMFLRRTSARSRIARGLQNLADDLTADIRRAGKVIVSHSTITSTPLPDLTPFRNHLLAQIANAPDAVTARSIFLGAADLADYDFELADAERIRAEFPLVTDTPRRRIEKDGRVSAITGRAGETAFGVPSPTWHQMMKSHERRVHALVPQVLHPAWEQLSNTYQWSLSDFVEITSRNNFVPSDRAASKGKALFYGYTGDFLTAFQLLVPQVENIARAQLKAAGDRTSRYADGVEDETSLPALLDSEALEAVFGVPLAFELRALFGGVGGPNLRHRAAHGQIPDGEENSPYPLYVWWLMWRAISMHGPAESATRAGFTDLSV